MKKIVYIETSIPSFYHEMRPEPEMAARRNWTKEWWNHQRGYYQAVTSMAVIEELERGNYPNQDKVLRLLDDIPILETPSEISEIIDTYISRKLMPADIKGDALHLALASFHACDFLLTWNCRHLANANKFGHIRRVNTLLGLYVPTITTPFELLSWED